MSTILFRCPNTGYPVQGWFAHGMSRDCKDIFEGVICLACGGVHLVNPKTGKALGAVDRGSPEEVERYLAHAERGLDGGDGQADGPVVGRSIRFLSPP